MTYTLLVAGTILNTYTTKEEAKKALDTAKHSYLAMVHPQEAFRIRVDN